jgi:hypothetical protein
MTFSHEQNVRLKTKIDSNKENNTPTKKRRAAVEGMQAASVKKRHPQQTSI